MTDKQLSPAAQAVWDEYMSTSVRPVEHKQLAAAIRAVANQVVPIEYEDIHGCWFEKYNRVREQFLDIANELEGK
jgi:hypothetical protein